uniref:Uncharacterized protein n=1 Tax=Lotus japonicus TaxID=34305 RepID=I3SW60_LOTJA|nr:unknown [Lotus japonicus]
MAHISNTRAVFFFMVLVVGLLFATEVKGQSEAPAPSPDVGAGAMVTYSGAFVFSSLLLSLLGLLRH